MCIYKYKVLYIYSIEIHLSTYIYIYTLLPLPLAVQGLPTACAQAAGIWSRSACTFNAAILDGANVSHGCGDMWDSCSLCAACKEPLRALPLGQSLASPCNHGQVLASLVANALALLLCCTHCQMFGTMTGMPPPPPRFLCTSSQTTLNKYAGTL
jgi:hypothetical protein